MRESGDYVTSGASGLSDVAPVILEVLSHLSWPNRLTLRALSLGWRASLAHPVAVLFAREWGDISAPLSGKEMLDRLVGKRSSPLVRSWLMDEESNPWNAGVARQSRTVNTRALSRACAGGHADVVEWLAERSEFDPETLGAVLHRACKHGHLEVAAWVTARFGFGADDARKRLHCRVHVSPDSQLLSALEVASAGGHAGIVAWLVGTFDLTSEDARSGPIPALELAILGGHVATAKWLAEAFGFGAGAVGHFHEVCRLGHLEMAQWLASADGFLDGEVDRAIRVWALCEACSNGHLDVARWAAGAFELTTEDARAEGGYAFSGACAGGYLDTVEWLAAAFGLTAEDARRGGGRPLKSACAGGHLETAQWIVAHFGLSRDDVNEVSEAAARFARQRAAPGHESVLQWLESFAEGSGLA